MANNNDDYIRPVIPAPTKRELANRWYVAVMAKTLNLPLPERNEAQARALTEFNRRIGANIGRGQ